jgi:uncharacterized protein (TIGR02328 family)
MRLWHKNLIPYLPDMQLKGQWRECCLIATQIKENGTPNHLLVNKITEYNADHFHSYCVSVWAEMDKRGFKMSTQSCWKIAKVDGGIIATRIMFDGWHNKEYLRICMSNLAEKHFYGVGKSRITDEEWETLCRGYKEITGEEYVI